MADYSNNIIKCSNGKAYIVTVSLSPDKETNADEYVASLDCQTLEEISFASSLNQLLLTGHVIYVDKYGQLDKFVQQQECYCKMMIAEAKRGSDGVFENNDIDDKRAFMHTFIANRISILDRQSSFIKYKIDLVSSNWHQCIANVIYSNNDKDPEPIFTILKNCISMQNLDVDDDTFKNVKSNVKMNYVSKLNDTLLTTVPYLLHKLFFLPSRDESMKFLYYDWLNRKYKVLDLTNVKTLATNVTTVLSFFKSNVEFLVQQEPTNIGAFNQAPGQVLEYKNMFAKDMYAYDIEKNEFINLDIKPKQVVQYMNSNMSYDGYVPKYHEMNEDPKMRYMQSSSYWNASLNVYNDSMRSVVENGAIVLNMTGDITLQCASLVNIGIDRDMNALTTDSIDELEKMKVKYKMFEGPWIASSVQTFMRPTQKQFKQRVALFRNYMLKNAPPKNILLA